MVYEQIEDLVGNTPILRLSRYFPSGNVFCKLEYMNPTGSFKDRVAIKIVQGLEQSGDLKPGDTLVEASSGNTAISVAMFCKAKGYKFIVFLPTTASEERKKLLSYLGADVRETQDLGKAIKGAQSLSQSGKAIWVMQFHRRQNMMAHYEHTGPEILRQLDGKVDVIVAGAGTGGLLAGIRKFMLEHNPSFKTVRVEPTGNSKSLRSAHINRVYGALRHKIEGISVDVDRPILEEKLVDELVEVTDEEAFNACRRLASTEGVMAGLTTGANVAAIEKRLQAWGNQRIVTIAADSVDRYFSTDLFADRQSRNKVKAGSSETGMV